MLSGGAEHKLTRGCRCCCEPQGCEKRAVYERRDRQVSWQHQKDRTPLWPDSVKSRRRGAGTMWPRCGCLRAALSARRCKRQRVRILRQLWSGITGIGKLSGAWKTTLITEQIINQTIICRRIHCVRLQAHRSSIDHYSGTDTQCIWMRIYTQGVRCKWFHSFYLAQFKAAGKTLQSGKQSIYKFIKPPDDKSVRYWLRVTF